MERTKDRSEEKGRARSTGSITALTERNPIPLSLARRASEPSSISTAIAPSSPRSLFFATLSIIRSTLSIAPVVKSIPPREIPFFARSKRSTSRGMVSPRWRISFARTILPGGREGTSPPQNPVERMRSGPSPTSRARSTASLAAAPIGARRSRTPGRRGIQAISA